MNDKTNKTNKTDKTADKTNERTDTMNTLASLINANVLNTIIVTDNAVTARDLKEVAAFAAGVSLLDVDRMTDNTTCGGAIGDYYVTLRDNKRNMLAAYPLDMRHSRFVPADMYGGTPRDAASLYQYADADALASGRYAAFIGVDGQTHYVKGSASGKPYALKLTLKAWRDRYALPVVDAMSRRMHGVRIGASIRNMSYTIAVEHDIEHK